ncbi:MAG: MATE family efflux transporter [Candidatus Woesearchaeota archaeon]
MGKNNPHRLGNEPVLKLLVKLSIPSVIGMLVNSLYNIIDSIYIGHLSTDGLAALSLAFPIQLFLISIAGGFGVATSSLISRLLGEGNQEKVKETTQFVTMATLAYAVIAGLFGFFFAGDIIALFTSDTALISMGGSYLRIVMSGSVFMIIPMVFNNFLRGHGDTFNPMITMLIGATANIIIDPFLIYGLFFFPSLGVSGAAYATIFSRSLGAVYVVWVLIKQRYYLNIRAFIPDKRIIKELINIGVPAVAMMLLGSIMLMGANKIIALYSAVGIAVMGVYSRLLSLILMPIMGLGQGFQPLLGYNYGANNINRVRKTLSSGLFFAMLFSGLSFLLFILFPGLIMSVFTNDPELISTGAIALKRISIAFPFMGVSMLVSIAFQSIGKGLPSFLISLLRQIILLLPLLYLLAEYHGLAYAWYAFPIAESVSFVVAAVWLTAYLYRKGIIWRGWNVS